MQYRSFGKLDWKVSALGFGCMRLPTDDGTPGGKVLEDEAIKMIRYGIDQGINYVDTAYMYHNGASELVVGKALKDGYREKVRLATKSPLMFMKAEEDFDRILDEQLKKLQVDYIDYYLLHGINARSWDMVKRFKLIEKAEAAQKAGKIKYIGFSFHDKYEVFEEVVNAYDKWTFCQIQYNYLDTEYQAGLKGLKLAASKGIAISIMEPLLGGKLVNPPKAVKDLFEDHSVKRSPADWGLQWLWDQPEASVVLSGMSAMEHVKENLASADKSAVNSLKAEDLELIEKAKKIYAERTAIPCTGCSYCMPCPNGVDIPKNFKEYNDAIMHEDFDTAKNRYVRFYDDTNRAGACVQCQICEEKCPQNITISGWMPKVHESLI